MSLSLLILSRPLAGAINANLSSLYETSLTSGLQYWLDNWTRTCCLCLKWYSPAQGILMSDSCFGFIIFTGREKGWEQWWSCFPWTCTHVNWKHLGAQTFSSIEANICSKWALVMKSYLEYLPFCGLISIWYACICFGVCLTLTSARKSTALSSTAFFLDLQLACVCLIQILHFENMA